jgi:excisionase family DNA binding protein
MNNIQWHIDSIERSLAEIKRMAANSTEIVSEALTTKGFAKRCDISRTTVINMIDAGVIDSQFTTGGHRRISVDQIEKVFAYKDKSPNLSV